MIQLTYNMSFLLSLSRIIAALNNILPNRFNIINVIANQIGLMLDKAQVVHITSMSHKEQTIMRRQSEFISNLTSKILMD